MAYLNEIQFESIDNTVFSYGRYNGCKIVIDTRNGYINATQLIKQVNSVRVLRKWKTLRASKELMTHVNTIILNPPMFDESVDVKIEKKNLCKYIIEHHTVDDIRGTYYHQDIIPFICAWASPQFAVTISKIVNKYFFEKENRKIIKEKDDKIDTLIKRVDELLVLNREQDTKLSSMDNELQSVNRKLDIAVDGWENTQHISELPPPKASQSHVLLIVKYSGDVYAVCRRQKTSVSSFIKEKRDKYGYVKTVLELITVTNPISLWNNIKVDGRIKGIIRRSRSNSSGEFYLRKGVTSKTLIDTITTIYREKFVDINNELKD